MRSVCVAVTAIGGLAAFASGDVICHSVAFGLARTNWSGTADVPRFDPSLGTLNSVRIELTSNVTGSAGAESLDAAPSTISLHLGALVRLLRPDDSEILSVTPGTDLTFGAMAFDGTVDFAGSSGFGVSGVTAGENGAITTTDALELLLFSGTGSVLLPIHAEGSSLGSGAGNLILAFQTFADASVEVC